MTDLKVIQQEIEDLKAKLNQWNYEYYFLNQPSVSDAVFDKAMNRLIYLETMYPQFKSPDSPTVKVGGYVYDKFNKIKHLSPMLSLANAFNEGDLNKFNNDILAIHQDINYVVEPKIDGLSISLIYEQGKLVRAVTRGDGVYGEDVTNNVKTIKEIPLYLPKEYHNLTIDIRGEVYMTKKSFIELNNSLSENQKPFANPRNAAAGSLRNLDTSVTKKRNLQAFFYQIPNQKELGLKTQFECIEWLRKHNFPTCENIYLTKNIQEVFKKINYFTEIRNELPFVIDGIVIKLNQINYYDDIGYTAKSPKWAIAYKFPSEIGLTEVKSITADVGRTGKITYVANLTPIFLDGSNISHVTVNNAEYIKAKDIRIHDWVYIYKSGDVIPYLDYVDLTKRPHDAKIFEPLTHCPSCNSLLVKPQNEVDQRCLNHEHCISQIIKRISYFCERDCMNIQGVSNNIITKLHNLGVLDNFVDLYKLADHKEKIINANLLLKEKSIENILNAIEQSKNNSLEKLLCGLGIKNLGQITAKKIAAKFKTLDAIIASDFTSLISINDVGDVLANSIIDYFNNEKNLNLLAELKKLGVNTTYSLDLSGYENVKIVEKYMHTTFVITGTFSIERNKIKNILENIYNCKVTSKVTKKVNYLLCGEHPGSKLVEAEKLDVEIITEEFWK